MSAREKERGRVHVNPDLCSLQGQVMHACTYKPHAQGCHYLIPWREQVAEADKALVRLREVFKERAAAFREAVHLLFGYRCVRELTLASLALPFIFSLAAKAWPYECKAVAMGQGNAFRCAGANCTEACIYAPPPLCLFCCCSACATSVRPACCACEFFRSRTFQAPPVCICPCACSPPNFRLAHEQPACKLQ